MRKSAVVSDSFIAQWGCQPSGVDLQQNQTGLTLVKTIGSSRHLFGIGAVDKPFSLQGRCLVNAFGLSGLPGGALSDVKYHSD